MRNSDKLNLKKVAALQEWQEILRMLKRTTRCYFLDYGPDSRQCCAFSLLPPWPLSFTDIPDLLYFAIILRRGMKACTSEKWDLSFRARPIPNRQDLDESVRNLVCKKEIPTGNSSWTRQLDSDDRNRQQPIILLVKIGVGRIVWYENISL